MAHLRPAIVALCDRLKILGCDAKPL